MFPLSLIDTFAFSRSTSVAMAKRREMYPLGHFDFHQALRQTLASFFCMALAYVQRLRMRKCTFIPSVKKDIFICPLCTTKVHL